MLVEREVLLASLGEVLTEAAAGAGRMVFVAGEAGVGKSALVAAFVAQLPGGVRLRLGSCDSVVAGTALGPFLDAVPELTDAIEAAQPAQRPQVFRTLRAALIGEPTVLVLEDVHWADEATLDVIRFVGRRMADTTLLVIATFRDDEVRRSHPLTTVLGDLATQPGVRRLDVPPLSADGVAALVAEAGSDVDSAALHSSTGGNAFFVTEVLGAGTASLPHSVRDAVLARAAHLSEEGRAVLAAASILGRADLSLLLDVSQADASAVDICVQHGVLVEDRTTLGFRHELGRIAIEQTLAPGRRRDLHRQAYAALRRRQRVDEARLAHHAAGADDGEAVLVHAQAAAALAAKGNSHREAAELYRLALRYLPDRGRRRAELLERLSYECYLTDQGEESRAHRLEALTEYQALGDQRAVGVCQRWLSRLTWFLGRNEESERYAEAAVASLEPLPPDHEQAMAYSNMAQLRMLADDVEGACHWGTKALDLARALHDRDAETHALNNVGTALIQDGQLAEGAAMLARSLDLALIDDAHEHAARAYTNLGSSALAVRRYAEGLQHLRAGIAYCDERDLDSWRMYMSAWLARASLEQGRTDEALQTANLVLRHTNVAPISRMNALTVKGAVLARRNGGLPVELDQALDLATPTGEAQRLVPTAGARAEAAWLAGDTAGIVREVDRAWAVAVLHPNGWELGELGWWLALADVRRDAGLSMAEPFALMHGGRFTDAAAAWEALGCPLWQAYALMLAPALADGRTALDIVDGLGLPLVRAAVVRERYARGLPVPRGPRAVNATNEAGLTAREVDVLGLLVDGLSNAEIAARLFLSEKTASHHVSAILRKLGEPTRSRAAAKAVRLGIGAET